MYPLRKGFSAPTLDLLGEDPEDFRQEGYFVRQEDAYKAGPIVIVIHWVRVFRNLDGEIVTRIPHRKYVDRRHVSEIYPNDLGGMSIKFSDDVQYVGNWDMGIGLGPNTGDFDYEYVGRIRDGDEIVWENGFMAEDRKKLVASKN